MEAKCRAEVMDLHRFFQEWYKGVPDPEGDSFERLASVLHPDFELIAPTGGRMDRTKVLNGVREAHGRYSGCPCRISIRNCATRALGPDLGLATYEEWQDIAGETRGRLSTAVFGRRAGLPNGVQWLHVHEVWMDEGK
ncbi:MAG: hypothetical protein ACE5HQ_11215 [Gemmatimonadota bacterium]